MSGMKGMSGTSGRETAAYVRKKVKTRIMPHRKAVIVCSAALIMLLLFALVNALIIKPAEIAAAKRITAETANILTASLREVMEEYVSAGGAELAQQRQGADGSSVLFIDAVGMNLMASRIIERAQRKISALSERNLSVSIGTASGIPLLSGAGPAISVAVEPVGEVSGSFSSSFQSAGVNQTRYCAMLKLDAEVDMVLFGRAKSVSASVSAPICETVVIGGVPAAYTNVESMEDALNLIPSSADGD